MISIEVGLADRAYPVLVGSGARHELASVLPRDVARVAIVTQAGINFPVDPGREHHTMEIPDGEAHKTLATVEELCRGWASWGLTRADAVVATFWTTAEIAPTGSEAECRSAL